MRLFGRGREQEEQARQAREAQAGQGGITHSGPGELNISGQAFGQGAEVRTVEAGSEGPDGPGHDNPARGQEEAHYGHDGPSIVSTGPGTINVASSAVGNGIHLVNYAEPGAGPSAGRELEAG